MKKTTKILSVFMALLMVLTCVPMTAFAQDRDTSSLEAYLDTDNLAILVEDLLTALGDRKEEIVPSVLNICFQAIDALKDTAADENVDVMKADTEELADLLIIYLDEVLADADLNSEIKDFKSIIGAVLKGVEVDLNSVDGILSTLVGALDFLADQGEGFCGDAAKFSTKALVIGSGRKTEAISTKNSSGLEIVHALFGFLSDADNIAVIKTVVKGDLKLGNVNGLLKTLADIDAEALVNDLMGNLDVTINELLYDELIKADGDAAYADSAYATFSCDELLAAALLKLISGEDATKADAAALAGMTLYEIIGKYADTVIAKFALDWLNTELKVMINDLIAMDPQLEVLNTIINKDFVFTADSFNFTEMAEDGLFENMNNLVVKIVEILAQPAVVTDLGLKAGGNENITHNLTAFFGYLLKTLAANNGGKLEFSIDGVDYSFDFSAFTEENLADKDLEDMVVAVVNLFYPTLLQQNLPADVDSLEKLVAYTAYVCIDKFMVQDADIDFTNDYADLIFAADGKVKDISAAQWNDVLGEMGMDVAVYWLNDATNFGMTQEQLAALKADGWTWEDVFEDIVDWALNYIDGIPAVADHLTTERGVQDGTAWYKLNVVLNELLPFGFINGCNDETFTLDLYTTVMEVVVPSLYEADFAAFANLLATNDNENNPFNQPLIASVLDLVDSLLFAIFEHECGNVASFTKAATATHDGYEGTYCVDNGHYIDVTVIPATGVSEKPSDEPSTEPPTDEPSTEPPTDEPSTEPPTDEPEVKKGDVDGNGQVTAMDARKVLRAASRLETLEGAIFTAADVDGNGKITAMDARTILRVAARLESF